MSDAAMERESMEYDVVIVGAGPAGLSAAIRLKQLAQEEGSEITVCVLEKGSEVGAHILSGAVLDPSSLNELLPNWRELGAPIETEVTDDRFLFLGPSGGIRIPNFIFPPFMSNHGNYIVSLGNVCRWLAEQAEGLGVEIYPGFAASEIVYGEGGEVLGVATGDMGIGKDGSQKDTYMRGMELRGSFTLIAEGVRGSLAKQLMAKYNLGANSEPQKFGIGLKELWEVPADKHQKGLVVHTMGWPLKNNTGGGSFMYHFDKNLVSMGFVVHLNYKNPYLSPFDEFQRMKHHPMVSEHLLGGKRIAYGARAITEGGLQSLPKLAFPGGALIGCSAGFVNVPRIKGTHNAMKSGMLAAEDAFAAIKAEQRHTELPNYEKSVYQSSIYTDLHRVRNVKPIWSKFGTVLGAPLFGIDMWANQLLPGGFQFTLKHGKADHEATEAASKHKPIDYPKPDGTLSFDKLSSVFLSSTNHEEDQPVHLQLTDPNVPISVNLPNYAEPAQRYCPAGVYEVIEEDGSQRFQINAQNCVHCKTCDIKDPSQNITWTVPEGSGGPNYPNM